jgi:hypothetical protein
VTGRWRHGRLEGIYGEVVSQRCSGNLLFVLSPFPRRVTFRMESVRFSLLPAELQVMAIAAMDRGAGIADWVSALNTSNVFAQGVVETGFSDWVAGQPEGTSFGEFSNAQAEVEFVKDHVEGKGLLSAQLTLLTLVQRL